MTTDSVKLAARQYDFAHRVISSLVSTGLPTETITRACEAVTAAAAAMSFSKPTTT